MKLRSYKLIFLVTQLAFVFHLSGCKSFPYSEFISKNKIQFESQFPNSISNVVAEVDSTNKLTMSYRSVDSGTGPMVLFIHGSPGNWGGKAHFLNDPEMQKKYGLYAIDRMGYGMSEGGRSFGALSDQALPILEIIRLHKNNRKVILVGHSYGAPVALKAAWPLSECEQPQ